MISWSKCRPLKSLSVFCALVSSVVRPICQRLCCVQAVRTRALRSTLENRLLATAGWVAFFALMAIFPALATIVSLYGLFADPHAIPERLAILAGVVPASIISLLKQQVLSLAENHISTLSIAFLIGWTPQSKSERPGSPPRELSPIDDLSSSIGIIVDGTPSRHSAWALRRFGEEPSALRGAGAGAPSWPRSWPLLVATSSMGGLRSGAIKIWAGDKGS
jgi:hypothetical protein